MGLCQRTWRLSTASALEDISQFKTLPRIGQTQAKTQACEQCTVGADWLSQSGSQGRGWNNVRGLLTLKSVNVIFLFGFFFASIHWLHRLWIVQQGLVSLPFLHQLHATVGHKQHWEGGQRETWREYTKRERKKAGKKDLKEEFRCDCAVLCCAVRGCLTGDNSVNNLSELLLRFFYYVKESNEEDVNNIYSNVISGGWRPLRLCCLWCLSVVFSQ